ncbi:MAG: VPLPA-CTERM sorting domain-containing protein [Pseudomonadota bacterium]|nr:VPLPA-CTERM sorting domain-containing protein [Pseudomonadota bacterium]
MNLVRATIAGIGLALTSSVSQAQTIAINPTSDSATTGGTVNFSFEASDFATTGGAFDLSWDSTVLTYNGDFAWDPGFGVPPRDPAFDVIDLQSPELLSIGFGSFAGITFGPVPTTIGSLSFTMGGAAGDMSALTMVDSVKWGGFFDFATGQLIPMNYVNGQATNLVPIPAAVWLFGSGLLGLVGVARRKKQHA